MFLLRSKSNNEISQPCAATTPPGLTTMQALVVCLSSRNSTGPIIAAMYNITTRSYEQVSF